MIRPVPLAIAVLSALTGLLATPAMAVPSYARQTGLSCSACHTTPPELNGAGRRFKLLGYTDRADDTAAVKNDPGTRHSGLDLLKTLPISAWFESSLTSLKTAQPGTQNGNFELPQDVSLFLSGAWASHVGSFSQITYSTQDDHFTIDNTDVRFANKTKLSGRELVYGLTLNNNPTIEDLWNSTPGWGFPFIASDAAPTPTAAPIISSLAQDVAGLGAYAMWDSHFYLGGTVYRSQHVGTAQPNTGQNAGFNIQGVAPYWRAAWQFSSPTNQLEIGTYGMHMASTPNSVSGVRDTFTDWAFDFQLDHTLFRYDTLSVRGTYIHESSTLDATLAAGGAQTSTHHLDSTNINAAYHFGNRFSASVGWFDTSGTADSLLFPQSAVSGSANGDPKSAGFVTSFSYWPVQNVQLGLQYTAYTRFNGASTNYDGAGRDASANNTTYVLARFVF
jgi:hypothetical protein